MNEGDVERLKVKYRKILKCMLALPDCTSSAAVYFSIGVLPASAQRDVEILGLLGQLALCDEEAQNIKGIIEHSLSFYGIKFNGWSGLVRRTCLKYGLPDPLQYRTDGEVTARKLFKNTGTRSSKSLQRYPPSNTLILSMPVQVYPCGYGRWQV